MFYSSATLRRSFIQCLYSQFGPEVEDVGSLAYEIAVCDGCSGGDTCGVTLNPSFR